jgi:hypothetical protein
VELLAGQEIGSSPASSQCDERGRVAVDVGPLLAVHLDVDEVLVHERGDPFVLERLALHHVAPVACRVRDRQEDRLVLGARLRERLVAPGIPVHRVAGVLLQVGALLAGETVRLARF